MCTHDPNCSSGNLENSIAKNISKGIWQIIGVLSFKHPFAYTVGASIVDPNLPEIIISGLSHQTSFALINDFLFSIKEGRETLRTDSPYTELANMPCYLKKLTMQQVEEHMCQAKKYQGTFEAYQLVFPDPRGRFPWEIGYGFPKQELLYL